MQQDAVHAHLQSQRPQPARTASNAKQRMEDAMMQVVQRNFEEDDRMHGAA